MLTKREMNLSAPLHCIHHHHHHHLQQQQQLTINSSSTNQQVYIQFIDPAKTSTQNQICSFCPECGSLLIRLPLNRHLYMLLLILLVLKYLQYFGNTELSRVLDINKVYLVTRPLSLFVCAVINCRIDLGDVTVVLPGDVTETIVPKLLSNKRPETGEAVQELGNIKVTSRKQPLCKHMETRSRLPVPISRLAAAFKFFLKKK